MEVLIRFFEKNTGENGEPRFLFNRKIEKLNNYPIPQMGSYVTIDPNMVKEGELEFDYYKVDRIEYDYGKNSLLHVEEEITVDIILTGYFYNTTEYFNPIDKDRKYKTEEVLWI